MAYINADGLYQKIGPEKAVPNKGGEYRNNGQLREVEFKIDLTTLTQTETPLSDTVFFPAGVRVAEVKVVTHTAAVTGTAIDLGLIRTDRTTETDYDGFLAVFPTASMNAINETTILTGTTATAGAYLTAGTLVQQPSYVSCSRTDGTAFTAGIIYVTIKYYTPV